MCDAPIGFFDSGIGGTTIWRAVVAELPYENTCLIADSGNAPYGEKSPKEIQRLCCRLTDYLIDLGCKLIIVACNTATLNAVSLLRERYSLPFIAIEPAIKPASIASQTGVIGVLATQATLQSQTFQEHVLSDVVSRGVRLITRSGRGLVDLIERGQLHSEEMQILLKEHCQEFRNAGIDQLVLGCSHYPYLIPQLTPLLPTVAMVDSGEAVARQTRRILTQQGLLNMNNTITQHTWYSSGHTQILAQFMPENIKIMRIEK